MKNKIADFFGKYKNYLGALCLLAALIVLVGVANRKDTEVLMSEIDLSSEGVEEDFEIDAHEDINDLINRYFADYSESNTDALEVYVKPLTRTEESYIEVYSKFVEGYENIVCYTKSGLKDSDYIVSAYLDRKFVGADTPAPGLDFFYVETDENGELYINNVYSQFNQSNHEENTDPQIEELIAEFENSEDMAKLKNEVQSRFERAVSSDENLRVVIEETVPAAIAEWANEISQIAKQQREEQEASASAEEGSEASETVSETTEPAESDGNGSDGENGDPDSTSSEGASGESETGEDDPDTNEDTGDTLKMYTITELNLRKKPSTDAKVITLIPVGKKLTAYVNTLDDDGWIKVKYNKKKGYVKREYLVRKKSSIPSDARNASANNDTASTNTDNGGENNTGENTGGRAIALPEGKTYTLSQTVNLRRQMSEDGELMATLAEGEKVTVVLSYAEGWTKVEWKDKIGYIRSDLIK